jgi:prepilin-type N-terminal cleavage/methylation domain-containing protein
MTISETGRIRPPGSKVVAPPRAAAATAALAPLRRGFTLIEILLALAIMAVLLIAAITDLGGWRRGQALDAGTERLATALRMARADAANLGRRIRLSFDVNDSGVIQLTVLWEVDPLGAPGQFTEHTACTWDDYISLSGVQVERCDTLGTSIYQIANWSATGDSSTTASGATLPATITFEPDGSSDSVVIELVSLDAGDSRHGMIQLDGLTGIVTSRMLSTQELADLESQAAAAASSP